MPTFYTDTRIKLRTYPPDLIRKRTQNMNNFTLSKPCILISLSNFVACQKSSLSIPLFILLHAITHTSFWQKHYTLSQILNEAINDLSQLTPTLGDLNNMSQILILRLSQLQFSLYQANPLT